MFVTGNLNSTVLKKCNPFVYSPSRGLKSRNLKIVIRLRYNIEGEKLTKIRIMEVSPSLQNLLNCVLFKSKCRKASKIVIRVGILTFLELFFIST